jgi:hypothetical protein
MKVRYIGPFADDGVELHDGTWFDGNTDTEVEAELVARLLEQTSNWEPADDEARALLGIAPTAPPKPAPAPAPAAPAITEPAPNTEATQ